MRYVQYGMEEGRQGVSFSGVLLEVVRLELNDLPCRLRSTQSRENVYHPVINTCITYVKTGVDGE